MEHNFSPEQLWRQAGLNATATVLGSLAFLKGQGVKPEEWVGFIGTTFAGSWETVRAGGPARAVELVALDMVSIGARLVRLETIPENRQASAIFAGWPSQALLEPFGLSEAEALVFMDIFSFLATHIGLNYKAELVTAADGDLENENEAGDILIEVRLWVG